MESTLSKGKDLLAAANQRHILEEWPKRTPEEQQRMAQQIIGLNETYPGGVQEYIKRAQALLKDAKEGANPYDDFTPSVPSGEKLSFDDPAYEKLEEEGVEVGRDTGFVLVAGGLGERLGYSSIKIGIPISAVLPELTFIKFYIDSLKALEDRAKLALSKEEQDKFYVPLCIMTSDDTDKPTRELLEKSNYYGKPKEHITIVKQEKVPALIGVDGSFALDEKKFEIVTKPHGHGDVHTLLHQFGVAKKWKDLGKKWVIFFQDTNPLTFKSYLPLLAVSAKNNYDMNSATVPRKPGEAVGAICTLTNDKTKESLTINVEYNQLDGVLKAKYNKDGDVAGPDGYSDFPGNINVLVFKLESYCAALDKTKGCVPEFVNPKYADASKTVFKTPTRLECMMQEFPKLFAQGAKVGFTRCDRWLCFSAVKNNLTDAANKCKQGLPAECASTCEADFFYANIQFLKKCNVEVEMPGKDETEDFAGVKIPLYPKVVLLPSFYLTTSELRKKIAGKWKISRNSTLILEGRDTIVKDLVLDGSLWINKSQDKVEATEKNYIRFVKLAKEPDYLKIRAYRCENPIVPYKH